MYNICNVQDALSEKTVLFLLDKCWLIFYNSVNDRFDDKGRQ